jgi:uncharacterized protein (DUF2141 family)
MKKYAILALALSCASAQAATITVNVGKVKIAKGDIRASLCESEAAYKADKCGADIVVKAIAGTTVVRFENVKSGTYGIQLFHDKNSNGDMDYNFVGYPKEGYGLSNNIKPKLSKPGFKAVSFIVGETDIIQSIELIN